MIDINVISLEKKILDRESGKNIGQLFYGMSVKFRSNRIYALTGPPKSGKSMFLRLLMRLAWPDKGSILLNGMSIQQYDDFAYRKYLSAALSPNHFFTRSVSAEISYTSQFHSDIPLPNIKSRVFTISSLVLLSPDLKETAPEKLSNPDQAKLKMARALFNNTDIILFDDTLDQISVNDAIEIISNLKKISRQEEKILIYTTHQKELFALADETIKLKK